MESTFLKRKHTFRHVHSRSLIRNFIGRILDRQGLRCAGDFLVSPDTHVGGGGGGWGARVLTQALIFLKKMKTPICKILCWYDYGSVKRLWQKLSNPQLQYFCERRWFLTCKWRLCLHYLFLISPSFAPSGKLCFLTVAFPGHSLSSFTFLCPR